MPKWLGTTALDQRENLFLLEGRKPQMERQQTDREMRTEAGWRLS